MLLDNVANGWRYKPVGWRDVAIRGMDMNAANSLAGQQVGELLDAQKHRCCCKKL